MQEIPPQVLDTAKKLAKGAGYGEGYTMQVVPGFLVPRWIAFISRAEQLVTEREAFK